MKNSFAALLLLITLFACKKENDITPLRCGTVSHQPAWAKNFSTDSLFNISEIIYVLYHSHLPSNQIRDTSYTLSVPIRFMSNGSGLLNNNISFSYQVVAINSDPEIIISNLSDISPLFPFVNNFLNQAQIKVIVENYQMTGGQFRFSNGVQYPLTTQTYENSYLSFKRN